MDMEEKGVSKKGVTRRTALRMIVAGSLGAVGISAWSRQGESFWQIDPAKCQKCGRCETECVLPVSAVKCVHQFQSCGYCDFCSGYYREGRVALDTAAENLLCPRDALKRTFVEEPYFQYTVDESLCTACGKCVKGCGDFGNGSLIMQVKRELCLNCNDCAIARNCPSDAFVRVSPEKPYIFKKAVFDA